MSAAEKKVIQLSEHSDGIIGGRGKKIPYNHTLPIYELAATYDQKFNGGEKMDNSKLLEKYMDKVDADRREMESRLLKDAQEREARIREETLNRENRFNESLKTYQKESKEREERYLKEVEEIKQIVRDGEKQRTNHTFALWTLAITSFLGIAAMVITVVIKV